MNSSTIGLISVGSIFAGALLGMGLQRRLPSHHVSKEMQDLVKLSAGTIATLTALVLGLLVSSAKSSFDAIKTGIVQSSAKSILADCVRRGLTFEKSSSQSPVSSRSKAQMTKNGTGPLGRLPARGQSLGMKGKVVRAVPVLSAIRNPQSEISYG